MKWLWVLALTTSAAAQGIQLSGGDSSIFHAEGGLARLSFTNSETSISSGLLNGHVYSGMTESLSFKGWNIKAGDVSMPFNLVTDFNTTNPQFPAVGLLVSHKTAEDSLTFFEGATATSYQLPFFFGHQIETPTSGIFYERELSDSWHFFSADVFSSGRQSAIQSVQFKPTTTLAFAASAGLGSNALFTSVRAAYETPTLKGLVSWSHHAADFQRVLIPFYTVAENSGLNARLAFTQAHWSVNADRQNLLSEVNGSVFNSTVNSMGVAGNIGDWSGSATAFYGTSNGQTVKGETAGLGFNTSAFSARCDVYSALGQLSESTTLTEHLGRHFSVNQFITGLHNVNAGAEFHSNTLKVQGGYTMTFLPVLGTFEKVLSASLSIQLPRGLRIDASTLTTPDGRTRWTAMGNTYQQGPLSAVQLESTNHVTGKFTYVGKVVDANGQPVAGAVRIGKTLVYADSTGTFRLPTKRLKTLPLIVVPEEFIAAGQWSIVTAPTSVTPNSPITITVRQR